MNFPHFRGQIRPLQYVHSSRLSEIDDLMQALEIT